MDEWLAPLLVSLAAVATAYVSVRKWRPDAIRIYVEAASALQREVEATRRELNLTRAAEDKCREDVELLREEIAALRRINANNVARIGNLERGYAPALLSRLLNETEADAFKAVLDKIPTPIVLTDSDGGGTFKMVNQAFADALGRTKEEVITMGWRKLIHEADARSTEKVESSAWSDPVHGHVTRYIHADGHIVRFRWFATPYINGRSFAVARIESEPLTKAEEP